LRLAVELYIAGVPVGLEYRLRRESCLASSGASMRSPEALSEDVWAN
jgi:hypothetical protein